MSKRDPTLPDFENPPVEETALSIQFAPIPRFGIPHYGLYWSRIRDQFPQFEVQTPIQNVMEQYETAARNAPRFGIRFVNAPDLRCWFLDETTTRLIQLQQDRFVHNWRRVKGDEKYPRYENVRETLSAEWRRFCSFLNEERMDQPDVNQCEVTYVNHIEYFKGWANYGELGKVIRLWSETGSWGFLPPPERVNMKMNYLLPDNSGRLHVSLAPVIRARDATEVLQVTLTARGAPKSAKLDDVFSWLDLGREWVVKGFADFTSEVMHKNWGRKS